MDRTETGTDFSGWICRLVAPEVRSEAGISDS